MWPLLNNKRLFHIFLLTKETTVPWSAFLLAHKTEVHELTGQKLTQIKLQGSHRVNTAQNTNSFVFLLQMFLELLTYRRRKNKHICIFLCVCVSSGFSSFLPPSRKACVFLGVNKHVKVCVHGAL